MAVWMAAKSSVLPSPFAPKSLFTLIRPVAAAVPLVVAATAGAGGGGGGAAAGAAATAAAARALGTPRQTCAPTSVPVLQQCDDGGGPTGAQSMHMHDSPAPHGRYQLHVSPRLFSGAHAPAPQLTSS